MTVRVPCIAIISAERRAPNHCGCRVCLPNRPRYPESCFELKGWTESLKEWALSFNSGGGNSSSLTKVPTGKDILESSTGSKDKGNGHLRGTFAETSIPTLEALEQQGCRPGG